LDTIARQKYWPFEPRAANARFARARRTSMHHSRAIPEADEFEAHARGAMAASPAADHQKLNKLLERRRQFLRENSEMSVQNEEAGDMDRMSGDEMNARMNRFLQEAASLLGAENFEKVFGIPPAVEMNVADPSIVDAQNKQIRDENNTHGFGI